MTDEDREYSDDERADYVPPPCPKCGRPRTTKWVRTTAFGTDGPKWMPGIPECPVHGRASQESDE